MQAASSNFVTKLIAAIAILASGCIVTTTTRSSGTLGTTSTTSTSTGTATVSGSFVITGGQPAVAEGVQVVEVTCAQGAQEQCNGLDDNCNGQIDEGCGYQSGDMQFTLAWQTTADLDIHFYSSNGMHLYYGEAQIGGGNLDRDDRGACVQNDESNSINVENIYWQGSPPGAGNYRVNVDYYAPCGAGPTPFTVQAIVGGQSYGPYQYTIGEGQDVDVFNFDL